MQVAGDPPALAVAGLRGGAQQRLAGLGVPAQPSRQPPHERCREEGEHQGAAEGHRPERPRDLGLAVLDVGEGEVGLEEQRVALGRHDPGVDLDDVTLVAVEAVLRLREVGDLGVAAAALEGLPLLGVEPEPLADQPGLVGVDDPALVGPQLDPAYGRELEALAQDGVEAVDGRRLAVRQAAGERRLHDAAGEHLGDAAGVGDGLPLGRPRAQPGGEQAGEQERDDHGRHELGDRMGQQALRPHGVLSRAGRGRRG